MPGAQVVARPHSVAVTLRNLLSVFKLRIGVFVVWAAFTGALLASGPTVALARVFLGLQGVRFS